MYKLYSIIVVLIMISCLEALAETKGTSLGAQYANNVWYSFEDGVVKEEPKDNWDIAFQDGQNGGIMINGQKGIQLFHVPGSTELNFGETIDTSGMSENWNRWINSDEKWGVGAFNLGLDGFESGGEFGWGYYDFNSHSILGETVFVIVLKDGSTWQVLVESLISGVYTVKMANLDGNNETTFTINKNDYEKRNYIYYSIENQQVVDREPMHTEWDLLFCKYEILLEFQPGVSIPYPVTGVKSGVGLRVAELNDVDTENVNTPKLNDINYSSTITTIGSDWKNFNLDDGIYEIVENRVYFASKATVDDPHHGLYKLVFTEFEGSSTGNIAFEQEDLTGTSVSDDEHMVGKFALYPNVINRGEGFTAIFDAFVLNNSNIEISIVDTNGETIYSGFENGIEVGINQVYLQPENLTGGLYFVVINNGQSTSVNKLIVK